MELLQAKRSSRRHYSSSHFVRSDSTDSQFTETDDELSFLESCMECDEDALYDVLHDGVTSEQINERDKSGRTGLSHACANGFMPILELLADVEDLDPNQPDNDANTPLIFAAQAGHDDVVTFLLHHCRRANIDQANKLGFTALMKASIQGRTRCAKLLLFAGANPNRRDNGRGLCAAEWARFCGRGACAEAINKYIHSKKYFLKKTFMMSREKWSSEPDLASRKSRAIEKSKGGNWITRHLSMKRKKRGFSEGDGGSMSPPIADTATRSNSSPSLNSAGSSSNLMDPIIIAANTRRPSCFEGVIPMSIIPKLKVTPDHPEELGSLREEGPLFDPPTIRVLDSDLEKEKQSRSSQEPD